MCSLFCWFNLTRHLYRAKSWQRPGGRLAVPRVWLALICAPRSVSTLLVSTIFSTSFYFSLPLCFFLKAGAASHQGRIGGNVGSRPVQKPNRKEKDFQIKRKERERVALKLVQLTQHLTSGSAYSLMPLLFVDTLPPTATKIKRGACKKITGLGQLPVVIAFIFTFIICIKVTCRRCRV